ncbi:MAG: hypothetical protein ACE5GH_00480 [Fidelibacterota bacterium]
MKTAMREILPGIYHWTAIHERIHIRVSSYYLADAGGGVLLDPMIPSEGVDWFLEHGPPRHILLTNRHHYRHSTRFVEAYGCTVWCHHAGLHEFREGQVVQPFEFGDELPGSITAMGIASLCPEETAFYIRKSDGVMAFADGLVRDGEGPLSFVPDRFMGEDPAGVKEGLKAAFSRLFETDFDHLLFAHGAPWIGGGKEALRHFLEGTRDAGFPRRR